MADPICDHKKVRYDEFEDMYRCYSCEQFLYPKEIGKEENPDAGYRKLGNG